MRLTDLIAGLPVERSREEDPEVTGITYDSRQAQTGDLFVALVGQRFDGRVFVSEAIRRGAVAVLASGPPPTGYDRLWLTTEDARRVLGHLASRLYGQPDRELLVIGVTGTNGKSTVSKLLVSILEAAGYPTGSLGTLGYRFRDQSFEGARTTPEASDLFHILRQMRTAGAEAVCVEVSSHGLALGRVEGTGFDLALFTNLSRDHFDFHRDFEDYFDAKRKLFEQLKQGAHAVVNQGDPYGRRLAGELPQVLTFGDHGDVHIVSAELDTEGTRAVMATPRGDLPRSRDPRP
jgi:UDP-N-acetylmuramoyl-L-alanyl-D-glutamate--2,6-diaminopimelate ligase